MKKFLALILVLLTLCALVACGDGDNGGDKPDAKPRFDFYVTVDSQRIELGASADAVIASLGTPKSTEEVGGCAGFGSNTKYVYDDIEIYVIENESGRFIDGFKFLNDFVSDTKGVSIGTAAKDFVTAYGDAVSSTNGEKNFSEDFDVPYSDKPAKRVAFYTISNGVISKIEYRILVENQ